MRSKNGWELYCLIYKSPNEKWYYYMHYFHWSEKKIKRYLNILLEDGLIRKENDRYRTSTVLELTGK